MDGGMTLEDLEARVREAEQLPRGEREEALAALREACLAALARHEIAAQAQEEVKRQMERDRNEAEHRAAQEALKRAANPKADTERLLQLEAFTSAADALLANLGVPLRPPGDPSPRTLTVPPALLQEIQSRIAIRVEGDLTLQILMRALMDHLFGVGEEAYTPEGSSLRWTLEITPVLTPDMRAHTPMRASQSIPIALTPASLTPSLHRLTLQRLMHTLMHSKRATLLNPQAFAPLWSLLVGACNKVFIRVFKIAPPAPLSDPTPDQQFTTLLRDPEIKRAAHPPKPPTRFKKALQALSNPFKRPTP